MPDGGEKGDIVIVRRHNSWFWLIPLDDTRTSVGLVMDKADYQALGMKPEQVFEDAVRTTPAVRMRFDKAEALGAPQVAVDFSYRNKSLVSPRVVRVGDAAGFIDPVFSSGVMLAMTSGRDGARAVAGALAANRAMTPAMKAYEKRTWRNVGLYWRFIGKFYQLHFAQLFFQPVQQTRHALRDQLRARRPHPSHLRHPLAAQSLLPPRPAQPPRAGRETDSDRVAGPVSPEQLRAQQARLAVAAAGGAVLAAVEDDLEMQLVP